MEESIIDKVLQQVDIVDVVSHYVQLTKKGRNFVGICPFHDDTSPSLTVSREKRIFNCFVCNTGGNAISFVQKMEKCGFKEAFNKVIDIGGLSEDLKMKITQEITYNPYDENQQRQIKMNETIQNYLSYNIKTVNNEGSLDYLRDRGISEESQEKFGLGYLHDAQIVANFLEIKCGFTKEEIAENDFFRATSYGLFSPYEHRITIPIYDRFNYLIGFAGRKAVVETKLEAKYINPSTTNIFQKSSVLFNHYNAKGALRGKDEIYVVEGYLDVIAMDAAGYPNSVAIMGTALTKEQIELFKRLKKDVVVALDGDVAGKRAMMNIYHQCSQEGLDVMFAVLPDGQDPDDLYRKDCNTLKDKLDNYQYGYEFALEYYDNDINVNFKKQKQQIKEMMIDFAKQNRDELDKSHFFQLIQKKYNLGIEAISKTFSECLLSDQSKEQANRYEEHRNLQNGMMQLQQRGSHHGF